MSLIRGFIVAIGQRGTTPKVCIMLGRFRKVTIVKPDKSSSGTRVEIYKGNLFITHAETLFLHF